MEKKYFELLNSQVRKQLTNNFELTEYLASLAKCSESAIKRFEKCRQAYNTKYKDSQIHLHSDFYCLFLYYLSSEVYKEEGNSDLANAIYYLNKMLHSVDIFYEVNLPNIMSAGHPLGTVLGRASYGNYFHFSQHCTVGNNKGIYPEIGEHVTMLMNSSILGSSKIGDNCIIAANACVIDQDIPSNSIVFGMSPKLSIKENNTTRFKANWTLNDN